MAKCDCEDWTLEDLSNALLNRHKGNKVIVVPMFQRGERWLKQQEETFIDSLIKGYPVGTMLFYKTVENEKETYILIDGLQRGNSIKKYMTNPTLFFYNESIRDETCEKILTILNREGKKDYDVVRGTLLSFIKKQDSFKNLQFYAPAKEIIDTFGSDMNLVGDVIEVIVEFFAEKQDLYDRISKTVIPVIVYSGEESTLPEIFARINSKGTPLDQYEIYAAAWPVENKFKIANQEIIEYVIKKYESLAADHYTIHGYHQEKMRKEQEVNAFEYLFGLGRYLVNNYDVLGFNKNISDDMVNPIAFELVNACLNDSDKIRLLYHRIYDMDVDSFEAALKNAVKFVTDSISVITKFKGNSRNNNKIFHSKYQMLSMISTTFKEMYSDNDYSKISENWNARKNSIARNLVQYYVYDIITNYWSEGGTNKIHSAAKPNRYMTDLSGRAWAAALDGYFEKSMLRAETKKVPNPRSEEFVILNCIYLNTFTAMDQLSLDKFDVEHIAPKEQMRQLIESCKGSGLAISCIANLCYLPEYVNRSKGKKNFYQDKKYLQKVALCEVEKKYSFTEEEDLDWMDVPYEKAEDFEVLKEYYTEFCVKRFDKMKHLFCDALDIEYVAAGEKDEEAAEIILPSNNSAARPTVKFADKCVQRLAQSLGESLIRLSRGTFKTSDNLNAYAITTSKMYKQGRREKYWFAYRRNKNMDGCQNQYYVFCCKDESTMLIVPTDEIEKRIECFNSSTDEDGNITHWHMVFFQDADGKITWMISKPEIHEINVNKFLL